MVAVIIALVASMTLIITTTLQNARLTRSRDEWKGYAIRACKDCGNNPSR